MGAVTNNPSLGRNPPWSRDELVLALDLYVRHEGNPPGKRSPEILSLSSLLNRIGRGLGGGADFRNANGVYMKAMNFRRFDPAYIALGRVGLQRGNRDEAVVWETYSHDPTKLRETAEAIQANGEADEANAAVLDNGLPEGFQEAEEGRLLTVTHMRRERSGKLVDAKKAAVVNAGGRLACEACAFDYETTYGERGRGYIEVHHVRPLSSLRPGAKTQLSDLALVCANCHRMIHANSNWLTMGQLRSILGR